MRNSQTVQIFKVLKLHRLRRTTMKIVHTVRMKKSWNVQPVRGEDTMAVQSPATIVVGLRGLNAHFALTISISSLMSNRLTLYSNKILKTRTSEKESDILSIIQIFYLFAIASSFSTSFKKIESKAFVLSSLAIRIRIPRGAIPSSGNLSSLLGLSF